MIRKVVLAVCMSFLVSACTAKYATGPKFSEAPPPPDKKGILYIYRMNTIFIGTPTIKINNKLFVKLPKLGYSYVYLSPGIYKLTFDYGVVDSPFITEFLMEERKVIFKRLYDLGGHKNLSDVPKDKALDEIKEYRYIEPLNTDF